MPHPLLLLPCLVPAKEGLIYVLCLSLSPSINSCVLVILFTVGSEATLDLLPLEMWSVDPANSLPLTRKTASQAPGHPSAKTSSPQPLQRLRTQTHPHDYSSAWSWDGGEESTRDLPEPELELRGMAPKCCLTISPSP